MRRLVEAGVRCLTVSFSFWDWYGGNFKRGRDNLLTFNDGISVLVKSLDQRRLDKYIPSDYLGASSAAPLLIDRYRCALLEGI